MVLKMLLYTPRWGHEDSYEFSATSGGWEFRHGGAQRTVSLNPDGTRNDDGDDLYFFMEKDLLHVPMIFKSCLEHLWEEAERGSSPDALQEEFSKLGTWINETTRIRPMGEFWEAFF